MDLVCQMEATVSHEETEPGAGTIAEATANAPTLPPSSEELIPLAQWPGDIESFCMHRAHTDLGNAQRLQARFGADLLNVRYHGWHAWDGRRWDRVGGEDRVQIRAQETAKLIRREAAAWRESDAGRAEAHAKHAARSEASGAISAMIIQARPHLTVGLDDMDRRPDLLACANGTIELGPRPRLRSPWRDDRLTRLCPVPYDEQADYPLFKEFLHRILPDLDVREFVQRWFGYCVTGFVHEHVHNPGSLRFDQDPRFSRWRPPAVTCCFPPAMIARGSAFGRKPRCCPAATLR